MISKSKLTAILALLIALVLVTPATGVMLEDVISNNNDTEDLDLNSGQWVYVPKGNQNAQNAISSEEIEVLEDSGWAAITRINDEQRTSLEKRGIEITEIKDRTKIELFEEGVSFDVTRGPNLEEKWTISNSDNYMVHLVAPAQPGWRDEIQNIAGDIHRKIGSQTMVLEMNDDQKARVENLDIVEWVGIYQPAYKVSSEIKDASGEVSIKVTPYDVSQVSTLKNQLSGYGGIEINEEPLTNDITYVTAKIDAEDIPNIAALETVKQIKNNPTMTLYNNKGTRVVEANEAWVTARSNLPSMVTGEDITIHIQDTGLDSGHPDFSQGPLGDRVKYSTTNSDAEYHGTHVTSCAAGNGYAMESFLNLDNTNRVYDELADSNPYGYSDLSGFAGRAPEASIVNYDGLQTSDWQTSHDSYDSRIFSNSWGPSTIDQSYDGAGDSFLNSNPDSLVVFAAGNDGPYENTVSGIANDKNTIAVGASENMRPEAFSDDPYQIASFSSRGPTAAGRIKPDLVENGEAVYAAKADDVTDEELPPVYDVDSGDIIDDDGDGVGDYASLQGTSMACPHVSGDAALVRQYLFDHRASEIGNPTSHLDIRGDLVKALMIYGAEDMGYGYPSFDQGWGLVNMKNIVNPPAPTSYDLYENSGTWQQTVDVQSDESPLKLAMTYMDDDSSGEALSTDYDVKITSPSGVEYHGNSFQDSWTIPDGTGGVGNMPDGSTYDYDTDDDGGDDMNNVEMLRVEEPEVGTWTIDVTFKEGDNSVTHSVVVGADLGPTQDYKVSMNYDYKRVQPLVDGDGENTFTATAGGSVSIPFTTWNYGTNSDTISLSANQPSGWNAPSFNPGSSISLDSSDKQPTMMFLEVPSGAVEGMYKVTVTGISNDDSTSPIAQDELIFNVDVVNSALPYSEKITTSELHQGDSAVESFTASDNTDYEIVAYLEDETFGENVMVKVSSDGGDTFGNPIQVSGESLVPGYLDIMYHPPTDRVLVSWHGWEMYQGSTADTRGVHTYIAYAELTDGYSTWTQEYVYEDGEGAVVSSWMGDTEANTYRDVSLVYEPGTDYIWQIVECMAYDNTNIGDGTLASIETNGKYSTDGGETWSDVQEISPTGDGNYYFFPNAAADTTNDKIALWYYARPSDDNNYGRDACYQVCDGGTWGSTTYATDNADQMQFPAPTHEGGTDYAVYFRSATYGGDGTPSIVSTSDDGASFTSTNMDTEEYIDDDDYIDTPVMDMTVGGGYQWVVYPHLKRQDDYNVPNIYTTSSNDDWSSSSGTFVTKDSYVKGRSSASGDASGVNVYYYSLSKKGDYDVYKAELYDGWESELDTVGPASEDVAVDNYNVTAGNSITAAANINDIYTGGTNIDTAEWFWDSDPGEGSGTGMSAIDGGYDNMEEGVTATVGTSGLERGYHTLYVRGRDSAGNWGTAESVEVFIDAPLSNPQVSITSPSSGEAWEVGTTQTIQWDTSDDIDTSFDGTVEYSTDGGGTWTTLTTYSNEPSPTSYDWTVPNEPSTDAVIRVTAEDSDNEVGSDTQSFVINDAPGAPSGLTVERWGQSSVEDNADAFTLTDGESETNDYTSTHTSDDTYHSYSEVADGGSGKQILDVTYDIPVTGDSAPFTLYVEGYESDSDASDTFTVSYTVNGAGGETDVITLPATEGTESYELTGVANGDTVNVQITDTWADRNEAKDTVYIDHLYIESGGGSSTEDNYVNWTASADDGAGDNDVAEYNIYRADSDAGLDTASVYTTVTADSSADYVYVDSGAGEGDGTDWWYRVSAVDTYGVESTFTADVPEVEPTSFDVHNLGTLSAAGDGWNFVSFNLDANSENYATANDLVEILEDTDYGISGNYDKAMYYDVTNDEWRSYMPDRAEAYNDLETWDNTMGVWIRMTTDDDLSVEGTAPTSTEIQLEEGWNMVSYPSDTASASDTELPAEVTNIGYFDASAEYNLAYTEPDAAFDLNPGEGYWLYCDAPTTWTVDY